MSSEKRRRARVQGGWASQLPKTTNSKSDTDSDKLSTKSKSSLCQSVSVTVVSDDTDSDRIEARFSNLGVEKRFVYEDAPEKLQEKLPVKIIKDAGVHDISTEPSGVSRIQLFPNFIESDDTTWMFDRLCGEIDWKHKTDTRNEEAYLQPRLTSWYGEAPYAYAGVSHDANAEWTPTLQLLKNKVEDATGMKFNSMLANLYRNNHDHVAWHSDNNFSLGPEPTIASLSFGATRNFELRKNPKHGNDYTYSEHLKIPVSSGTLLIMEKYTQDDWQHRVPIEYHERGPRINLTYRVIFPK